MKFEDEKFRIFKEHKVEVKSCRHDLGKMTTKLKNLERKFNVSTSEDTSMTETASSSGQQCASVVACTICSSSMSDYIPDHFCGIKLSPTCISCKHNNISSASGPFASFSNLGMPSSLAAHWIPRLTLNCTSFSRDLSSISSLRSHYVRLPYPGDFFTSMEDVRQEFKEFLRVQRQAMLEECIQS